MGASSAPSLEDSLCHGSRPDPWEQRRGRKGLREYAQLPRLHPRWSFRHGSKPAFLKSSFFRRCDAFEAEPLRGLLLLVKGLGGVLSEKAGSTPGKKRAGWEANNGIF